MDIFKTSKIMYIYYEYTDWIPIFIGTSLCT